MSLVYLILLAVLLLGGFLIYLLSALARVLADSLAAAPTPSEHSYQLNERLVFVKQLRRVVLAVIPLSVISILVFGLIHNTPMQAFVMEWLNLIVRWIHVVVGIMWIGASFYFIFLENNLNRTEGLRDELAGNLWAIHGGGFYFLEKYKVAPKQLPKTLHWFKYEAYFTWLSGFTLLTVVYYLDARAFLIDPQVADLSVGAAILIGIATLVVGWWLYDRLCKSPLVKRPWLFGLVGFLLLAGISFFLLQVLSSRAAYIHVGALIGTLMAGNVYVVIIPSQKALVKAATLGQPLDPTLGKRSAERSLHNNYLTLPVIFIMISNHFPSTYGHALNWWILIGLTLASAGIKHYWNLLERGQRTRYILPVSVVALLSLALVSSPAFEASGEDLEPVSFLEVQQIIQARCIQCHSASPTDDQWNLAPNNVMFDTPDQIVAQADRILVRAVTTRSMPLANKTGMTEAERDQIKAWVLQGASP